MFPIWPSCDWRKDIHNKRTCDEGKKSFTLFWTFLLINAFSILFLIFYFTNEVLKCHATEEKDFLLAFDGIEEWMVHVEWFWPTNTSTSSFEGNCWKYVNFRCETFRIQFRIDIRSVHFAMLQQVGELITKSDLEYSSEMEIKSKHRFMQNAAVICSVKRLLTPNQSVPMVSYGKSVIFS